VIKCLKLLTFVPMEEIEEYAKLKDQEINIAKKRLAFEVTKLIHGEEEALNAQKLQRPCLKKVQALTTCLLLK